MAPGATSVFDAAGVSVHRLSTRPPLAWPPLLSFFAARAIAGVDAVIDGRYLRSIDAGGAGAAVRIAHDAANTIEVRISPVTADSAAILARVRRLLDLDADAEPIDRHLAQDVALAPLIAARPGLRVPGGWDAFEIAIRAILGQQVTLAAGVRLTAALARTFGDPQSPAAAAGTSLTHLFPRPDQLMRADLAFLKIPAARARAITALATAVAADPRVLDARDGLDRDVARLTTLPGIGAWTAQYVALRAWRHPDAFPAGDVALQRALATILGAPVDARHLAARAEGWRPWRAYAAQHLWSALAGGERLPRQRQIADQHLEIR